MRGRVRRAGRCNELSLEGVRTMLKRSSVRGAVGLVPVLAALILSLLFTAPAGAISLNSVTADPTPSWRNQCAVEHGRLYRLWHVRLYSRYAYRLDDYGSDQRVRLRTLVKCQVTPFRRVVAARLVRRERQARVERLRTRGTASGACGGTTPYPGAGQCWAIPWRIVDCESEGSWSAANPSGAIGPYQLLGKGAPWPAHSPAARAEHHRIAYKFWAGGAGASHWVCK